VARHYSYWRIKARRGRRVKARRSITRTGALRQGMAGEAWLFKSRYILASHGSHGLARPVSARQITARNVMA